METLSQSVNTVDRRPFAAKLMIGRTDTVKLLQQKLTAGLSDAKVPKTFYLNGDRGAGLTWAAQSLEASLKNDARFTPVYVDLHTESPESPGVIAPILQLAGAVDQVVSKKGSYNYLKETMTHASHYKARTNKQLVLIIDSLSRFSLQEVRTIEHMLLGSLSELKGVSLVLPWSGRHHPMNSLALDNKIEYVDLPLFTADQTRALLHQLRGTSVDDKTFEEAFTASRGNPALTSIYYNHRDQGADAIINAALPTFTGVDNPDKALLYQLERLSIYDGFRHEEIQNALGIEKRVDARRQVIDPLIQLQLIGWREGNWKMNEGVKQFIQTTLIKKAPEKWKEYCLQAAALVEVWQGEFLQTDDADVVNYYEDLARYYKSLADRK